MFHYGSTLACKYTYARAGLGCLNSQLIRNLGGFLFRCYVIVLFSFCLKIVIEIELYEKGAFQRRISWSSV